MKTREYFLRAWNHVSSAAFSVVVIVSTAVISVFGTVIPQKEPFEIYAYSYGGVFAKLIYLLNFDDLYGSAIFKILMTALGLSLFSCGLKRLILALRNKVDFYLWGSFFAHLSILVIYAGVIFGGISGFSITVPIDKGASFFEPDSSFYIRLNDFDAKFDEYGRPLDFSSDLSVLENKKEVLKKIIRVNDPMSYKGVKIYQSSYGLKGILRITRNGGGAEEFHVFRGSRAAYSTTNIVFHIAEILPGADMIYGKKVDKYEPGKAIVLIDNFGWIAQGDNLNVGTYNLKFTDVKEYTVLQIKKDPGLTIVYFGFFLLMMGIGMMLYVKR